MITHAVDRSHSRLRGEEPLIQGWLDSWDSGRIHVKEVSKQPRCDGVNSPILSAPPPLTNMALIDSACATYATLSATSAGLSSAQQLEQFDSSNCFPQPTIPH